MRGQQNEEKLLTVKTTKLLEVTLAGENDQKIRMKVLGRRQHIASSPGMGGTSAWR